MMDQDEVCSQVLSCISQNPTAAKSDLDAHIYDIGKNLGRHAFENAAVNPLTILVATDPMEKGLLRGLVCTLFDLGLRLTLCVFLTGKG